MSDNAHHQWRIVKLEGGMRPYAIQHNPNAGKPQFLQEWFFMEYADTINCAREKLAEVRARFEAKVTETVIHTE